MKIKQLSIIALAGIITAGFSSCSKDDDYVVPEEQEYDARVKIKDGETADLSKKASLDFVEGTITREGNIYRLRDFRISEEVETEKDGETNTEIKSKNTFAFDFKENDVNNDEEGALYFAAATSKNLQANIEKGYSLYYINKPFEEVKANDDFIEAVDGTMGFEGMYFPNNEDKGWAEYTGRPNHQILPIENRTIILFKDDQPVFKFRINSVYSGEEAEQEIAPNNYFYYSVDYQEFK